jgi:hypothetical protein
MLFLISYIIFFLFWRSVTFSESVLISFISQPCFLPLDHWNVFKVIFMIEHLQGLESCFSDLAYAGEKTFHLDHFAYLQYLQILASLV